MIARVAMSPGAVASLNAAGAPADVFLRHAAICEAVEAHGYLVFANTDEGRQFVQAIKTAGPEAQAMWTKLVNRFSRAGRFENLTPPNDCGLDEITTLSDLASGWGLRTDLAVVPDDRASEVFGLAATTMSVIDPSSGIDIARAGAAAVSGTLAAYKQASRASVLIKDQSREVLWSGVLLPIARVSRSIRIVDRYVFKSLAQMTLRGAAADGFLAWLLHHLNRAAMDGCRVEIIGCDQRPDGQPRDADAAADLIRGIFSPTGGRLSCIEVVCAQPASYLPHDRHIGSSLGVGVVFPDSLDEFDTLAIRNPEGVEFSYRSDPAAVQKLQEAERRYAEDISAHRCRVYTR